MTHPETDALRVEATHDGTEAVIHVQGELDMTGTELFWAYLSDAFGTRPDSIAVEARRLTFIDSSGLRILVRARATAEKAGVPFRVSEPSPTVRRVLERTGLKDLLLNGC